MNATSRMIGRLTCMLRVVAQRESPTGRSLIIVMGMGRSGTSALTRVLSLCGTALPANLTASSASNPTGHWEPEIALRLNNEFLLRYAATWYDPTLRLQCATRFDAAEREAFIEQIRLFLLACPPAPLLVIKEPRIAALSAFWFEAARRAALDVK